MVYRPSVFLSKQLSKYLFDLTYRQNGIYSISQSMHMMTVYSVCITILDVVYTKLYPV